LVANACTIPADVNTLGERLSETENTDEMLQLAVELKLRGKKGIPGLLSALSSVSEQDRWAVVEYGRISVCIKTLHELAVEGVYTAEEVPILIRTFEIQTYMPDTYVTADTLRIITGVDPGYSIEFVKSYSGSETDEKARVGKIEKWKQWLRENRSEAKEP
jgi:hypothetical protein